MIEYGYELTPVEIKPGGCQWRWWVYLDDEVTLDSGREVPYRFARGGFALTEMQSRMYVEAARQDATNEIRLWREREKVALPAGATLELEAG